MSTRLPGSRRRRWIAALLFALASALVVVARADAHGKEVEFVTTCRAANPSVPLERRCEATVVFTTDRDPVTDARLTLRAERPGKNEPGIDGVEFSAGEPPGHYAATLTLPAYGTWKTTVEVLFPSEGQVQLDQEVLPPSGSAATEDETRIRLVVGFEVRDSANILALVLHLLGGVGILAANGAVLVGGLVTNERGIWYRQTIVRLFPRLVAGSIAVLAATGAYNARYNAPTRSPGLFRPGGVSDLPFGDPYLAVFAAKMVFAVVLMGGTLLLARRLRHDSAWLAAPVSVATASVAAIRTPDVRGSGVSARLAAMNLIAGGAVLVAVVVVDYLHLLTHAGSFVGL